MNVRTRATCEVRITLEDTETLLKKNLEKSIDHCDRTQRGELEVHARAPNQ
jgi:hypothetical protein